MPSQSDCFENNLGILISGNLDIWELESRNLEPGTYNLQPVTSNPYLLLNMKFTDSSRISIFFSLKMSIFSLGKRIP